MTNLVLGPILRHVGQTDATVWVETDRPCRVEILGRHEQTWTVAGHHYALVVITDLPAGSSTDYQVRLDGELAWPRPEDHRPPPAIRTIAADAAVRLAFGSCRYARADEVADDPHFDPDALVCLAHDLPGTEAAQWPNALLLLGDQVYADETTQQTQQRIRQRRDITTGSKEQVADFEEYTWLYAESWSDPDVRWLLSTVPTSMIFDDHDVRDDWNTSAAWRRDMQATDWWQERIVGALSSYWVYQHLGNLSPSGLAEDPLYQRVRSCGQDAEPLLREYATMADREADGAKGARWSYRRDFGPVRLVMIDSRCGRILDQGERSMISVPEFDWITEQVAGDYDHLLIGTSMPWLLARALHDLEAWNERLADGARGRLLARWSEKLRRAADLEHWAAFQRSFTALAELIGSVGGGHRTDGRAPASICVLSGDVHHAYVAQADYPTELNSKVYQLTCSPFHNYVPNLMKLVFRISWSRVAERLTWLLLTVAGLFARPPEPTLSWRRTAGPYFGNELMTFVADGRSAELVLAKTHSGDRPARLHQVDRLTLT
ncbi:MAG TPA: alkaline phosphatase D family protein [Jatrophihabitans sp.]|nr:alkaline phosphatase D family protein [Jatrophihabitans sp.]